MHTTPLLGSAQCGHDHARTENVLYVVYSGIYSIGQAG